MPFPNPRVLTSFLREYLICRKEYWDSPLGKVQSFFRDDKKIKLAECEAINRKFYNEKELDHLDGWIDLLYTLGKEGRKSLLFSTTLQAIRTYIIEKILESDEYGDKFRTHRAKLAEECSKIDKNIDTAIKARESKIEIRKKTDLFHQKLLELADLGDEDAIVRAAREDLFHGLECPNFEEFRGFPLYDELNESIPFCYHTKSHVIYFLRYLRALPKWQVKFEDFEITSSNLSTKLDDAELFSVISSSPGKMSFGHLSNLYHFFPFIKPSSSVNADKEQTNSAELKKSS